MPHSTLAIPETKPATELIDGHQAQKMSPYGLHSRVQGAVVTALRQWADARGRGRVGPEWDYDLTPPGDRTHRLVPDVAYLSYDRISYDDEEAAQIPKVAPNAAIEILSEGQTLESSQRRIAIFLRSGADVVILIEPRSQEAWIVDSHATRHLRRDDVIEHPAMPEFLLPLSRCFERVPPGGRR